MKKTCSVLLALMLLLGCCIPSAHALEDEDFSNSMLAFTVVVDSAKNNAMAGFVVTMTADTTYVLTDTMILEQGDPYVCATVLFRDGKMNVESLIPAEAVWMDSTSSIALLSVPTEDMAAIHRAFPALAPMRSVSNGDTLHRVGMDITEDNPNWSPIYCVYTTSTAIVSSNYPSGLFSVTSAPSAGSGILDMGGPVIDEQGVVVGISAYAVVDDTMTNEFIFGLDEVIDYLDSKGIPYAPRGSHGKVTDGVPKIVGASASGGGPGSSGSSGGSGSSGSSRDTGSSGGSGTGSGSSGGSSSGSSGGLIGDALSGGAIGLVAAGAAGVGIWLRKKKKPSGGNGQKTAGGSAPPAGALALVGIGGQMEGCRFPLQGASLTFGRDPGKCAIIYDSGTPGVSSLHCQLVLQEGAWCLTDLSSSYGTYLNGRKLEPFAPSPLRPGDTFWLGQPQNSFTLKEG